MEGQVVGVLEAVPEQNRLLDPERGAGQRLIRHRAGGLRFASEVKLKGFG